MAFKCTTFRFVLVVSVLGIVAIIAGGIIGWVIVPIIIKNRIADTIALRENSESWNRWKSPPVAIFFNVYIFHVDNPEEILHGARPRVVEKGPYVYREKREKDVKVVDEENSRIVYRQNFKFEFDPKASAGLSEDDVHTVVNVPALVLTQIVDNLKAISPTINLVNTAIHKMWPTPDNNPLFIKAKVKDYLFKGLPMICNQTTTFKNLDTTILCQAIKLIRPKTLTIDDGQKGLNTFAFFRYKVESDDGEYEIDSGIKDATKIGSIKTWNNKTMLSIWKGNGCNKIMGTDATIFRPFLAWDAIDSFYIYNTDACRTIKLTRENYTDFKGITGLRYVTDKNVFASVKENGENYCYCPQSIKGITHFSGCLKSGAVELSSCQSATVIISHPHYLMADPSLNSVEGLNPNKDKHQSFVELEPYTGYPLRAASRTQVNVFLKHLEEISVMKNISSALMPAIWIEEKFEMTDDLISMLNSELLTILRSVDAVRWFIVGLGITLTLSSFVYFYVKKNTIYGINS